MLAVIAVGWFGFELLTGRVSLHRGATVILGCFILFGAPAIARALLGGAQEAGDGAGLERPGVITPTPPSPPAYDPYAGASVPNAGPR